MLLKHAECITGEEASSKTVGFFFHFKTDLLDEGHILCSM